MIADRDIPGADPAAVIEQYEPYLQKLANRYIPVLARTGAVDMDDLLQVGRIAVADAQRKYNPENGSFMTYLFYVVRGAMRRELGFNKNTGAPPVALVSLDKPIADGEDITLADTIADPDAKPPDEPIIEDESKRETREQVRAAVERMRSDKQRTAIKLVWLEQKTREQAAAEMEMQTRSFYALEKYGRSTLRRDQRLRNYVREMPFIHFSISRFNSTWTSEVEYIAMRRLEHDPDYISRRQALLEEMIISNNGRMPAWYPPYVD